MVRIYFKANSLSLLSKKGYDACASEGRRKTKFKGCGGKIALISLEWFQELKGMR